MGVTVWYNTGGVVRGGSETDMRVAWCQWNVRGQVLLKSFEELVSVKQSGGGLIGVSGIGQLAMRVVSEAEGLSMTKEQKRFVLEELCPFVLRENGNGFSMGVWLEKKKPGGRFIQDGLWRSGPSCGTVCCIGGSIEVLMGLEEESTEKEVAKAIGLNESVAKNLCWVCLWPERFRKRFLKCRTPLGKAKVAVALLKEVVRTDGKCLRDDSMILLM